MYMTFERFLAEAPKIVTDAEPMSFLPGPVPIAPDVRAAFASRRMYHRDAEFQQAFGRTKSRLCRLTGSRARRDPARVRHARQRCGGGAAVIAQGRRAWC